MESFKLIDLERGIAWYASKEVVFTQISLRGMFFDWLLFFVGIVWLYACSNSNSVWFFYLFIYFGDGFDFVVLNCSPPPPWGGDL